MLASGSKGNAAVVSAGVTSILVDAGLSCRELLRRMAQVGQDPAAITAILITHEHLDHVAGLAVLARRLNIPVFFTEATHRAWVRMLTPRKTMTYAQWMEQLQRERAARNAELPALHLPAHLHRDAGEASDAEQGRPEVEAEVVTLAAVGEAPCEAEEDRPVPFGMSPAMAMSIPGGAPYCSA